MAGTQSSIVGIDTDSSERVDGHPADESRIAQNNNEKEDFETRYLTGIAKWLVLGPVTLAYFTFFLDLAVLSTAAPAITTEFNSLVDIGWYGGAYQLGSAAFQPMTGKLFRYCSIKWTFLSFFLVFVVGSALCGAAQSSSMFIVGRAIAGVGSSGIGNGALTIISAILPPRAQARAMGVNMGLGQLGLALGPIVGGLFTEYVSWRWCFYVNLPIGGVVGVLLLMFRIPEPTSKPPARQVLKTAIKSLDLPGFVLIGPAAIMFLLGIQYGGNQYAWNSPTVIGLIVGGLVTFILFLVHEYRTGDDAMVPFAMLRHRIIWSAAGNMFFLLATVLVADFYLAIYFQAIHDDTPLMSGVHILPTTLALVLFTVLSGTANMRTTTAQWIGYQVLYGVGGGSMAAGAFIAVQNCVPASQIPTAMSIVLFCQNIGAAVALPVANAIFTNMLRAQLRNRNGEIGVDPEIIIGAGVRAIRNFVQGAELTATLEAYSNSVDVVMYLGIAVAIAAFAFAWGLGFKDIRKEKKLKELRSSDANVSW
ncbi:MFS general substrate transporter [Nemania sp. FL0916]|nr:MFS general substrate transporter [Nemania sp. FL0916]